MSYDRFKAQMEFGYNTQHGLIKGVQSIPLNLPKLNSVVFGIRKSIYTLIAGGTGTGKTAFVDQIYVLDVFDWFLEYKKNNPDSKLEINWIYRSMERNKIYKYAKWTALKLYKDYGILVDVSELLGWVKSDVYTKYSKELAECELYFKELEKYLIIVDGRENPTGVRKHIEHYAEDKFIKHEVDKYTKHYEPKNPELYTIIIHDHIGLTSGEQRFNKKETIDKMSEYYQILRDRYGFIPVVISQFNRAMGDTQRRIKTNLSPILEDIKDSGNSSEDADLILALFNPWRYEVLNHLDYDVKQFISPSGENRFRACSILKNSFGVDDVELGLNFIGECGYFKELKKASEMLPSDYIQATYVSDKDRLLISQQPKFKVN